MDCHNCIHKDVCAGFEVTQEKCNRFIDAAKTVELPCKPGDDLFWYNDEERTVECQWQGVEGVVVTKDGFGVIDNVENVQEIGTQWTCLTAQECEEKFGVRSQNRHFMERFMEAR